MTEEEKARLDLLAECISGQNPFELEHITTVGQMPLRYALCCLELGLRWLHDSVERDRRLNKSRGWQDPAGRWFP